MYSAAALADGEGDHWRVGGRKWCAFLSGKASAITMLHLWSTWKDVGHTPSISTSGTVLVACVSR